MVPASITVVVYYFNGRTIQIVATTAYAVCITLLMCWQRYELVSIIGVVKILEDEATWQLYERQLLEYFNFCSTAFYSISWGNYTTVYT